MVKAPTWKWEWNTNTILFLLTIAGGLTAWGYTLARFETAITSLDDRVTTLETKAATQEADSRARVRMLDAHELRLATVEKQASDAAVYMRSMEATLSSMVADIRVIREILARVETSNGNRRLQPDRP